MCSAPHIYIFGSVYYRYSDAKVTLSYRNKHHKNADVTEASLSGRIIWLKLGLQKGKEKNSIPYLPVSAFQKLPDDYALKYYCTATQISNIKSDTAEVEFKVLLLARLYEVGTVGHSCSQGWKRNLSVMLVCPGRTHNLCWLSWWVSQLA